MAWDPEDPLEKRKRVAWSIAASMAAEKKEDALSIYNKILDDYKRLDRENVQS